LLRIGRDIILNK